MLLKFCDKLFMFMSWTQVCLRTTLEMSYTRKNTELDHVTLSSFIVTFQGYMTTKEEHDDKHAWYEQSVSH